MSDQTTRSSSVNEATEVLVDVAQAGGGDRGWPVSLGVPFPAGMVTDPARLGVIGPDGSARPTAGRTLLAWPDGSVRWGLLAFTATQTGTHRVRVLSAPAKLPSELTPVHVRHEADRCTVDNGLVRLVLAASGPGPVEQIAFNGHEFLTSAAALRFSVDNADTTRETRRRIKVLEQNPLQARIRIDGACVDESGQEKLTYRLAVELWAGWPCVRLDYQFFQVTPGADAMPVRRMAFDVDLATHGDVRRMFHQVHHGVFYRPRTVENPQPVGIVADDTRGPAHVEDPAMLLDEAKLPYQLRGPLIDTLPWLGVVDAKAGVFLGMEDFQEMRPKRLFSAGSRLGLDIWPESAGTLDLPQGRSRRVALTLGFTDARPPGPANISALLEAPRSAARATVSREWLDRCREFRHDRMLPFGQHARFEHFLRQVIDVQMPQGMFDLGDTPDAGYLRTYIPLGTDFVRRRPNAPELQRVFVAGAQAAMVDWAMPQLFEPVWANNEYDLIHALAIESMRTGRSDLLTPLRRAVRHNIEVDFVHYSDYRWCHRATPTHCPDHTRNGAYPSHFWTQGLLEYWCLSGDPDAREVAMALGDKIIEVFHDPEHRSVLWGFSRELGWPMIALSCLSDLTGEARYLKLLDEIIDFLVAFDREHPPGAIKLSGVDPRNSFVRQMLGSFFGYASMIEGIDLYLDLRPRPEVERWFVQLLRELRSAAWQAQREGQVPGVTGMVPQAMAIGYERTGEEEFLDVAMVSLDALIDSATWLSPRPETKPIAMLHRGLARFLGHAQRTGRLENLEYPTRRALLQSK